MISSRLDQQGKWMNLAALKSPQQSHGKLRES